jgi:hypothetical protein
MDMLIISLIIIALIILWQNKTKAEQIAEDYLKDVKKCLTE